MTALAVPHTGMQVLEAGEPLAKAHSAMILIHGRGATAADIMTIAKDVTHAGFVYLAPQAEGNSWYPYPFTSPLEANEPYLSAALGVIESLLAKVEVTVPAERIILLGFSQGACLTLEFAARHARRYGGVVGLSGGLIGPQDTPRDYAGSFEGTPVFLGCSDIDPHIPKERVLESAEVFKRMGALVIARLYPGMGHAVNPDEIEALQEIVGSV